MSVNTCLSQQAGHTQGHRIPGLGGALKISQLHTQSHRIPGLRNALEMSQLPAMGRLALPGPSCSGNGILTSSLLSWRPPELFQSSFPFPWVPWLQHLSKFVSYQSWALCDRALSLPAVPQFIVECHGNTLLPQFLGMYRLTVDGVETYMVVTRNVFSHRLTVHRKYDLKGSTVSREASDKEKAKDLPTFKDNDFLNEGQKLHVGEDSKKNFLEKLKRDVEFLAQLKIMDYSLLVGIHDVDRAEQEEMEVEERAEDEECENDGLGGNPISSYGTPPDSPGNLLNYPRFFGPGEFDPSVDVYAMKSHDSAPRKEVYFMAIIDILTPYDTKKKAAHAAKTVKHGAGAEISTVNPEQYSKRFNEFISSILT
uniref:Phosphatidylinositol-5-phosphate 4-kinase type 2 beta n=1 Tax=Zonotrichia albicollis TaxID=44394 RepID=A0A8D2QBY1_ZONAL